MADIDLRVRLDARAAETGSRRLGKSFDDTGRAARRLATGVDRSGTAVGRLGASLQGAQRIAAAAGLTFGAFQLTRGIQAAVTGFVDFDAALNRSLAIMGDVSDFMREDMARAARQVSRELNLAATDAAESFFFLASAGLSAEQSVAALPAVATFAKAGMFDLATATDLATDAQSALGLTVDDAQQNLENLTRVTDVLVKANTLANATVEQFSTALTREAGAALKSFNIDMEEGVAVLAAFADQGIKGEVAGSGLSRILRLVSQAAVNNQAEMRKLGLELFDVDGNIRNLADVVEELEDALGGMSDAQRTAALQSIGFEARVQGILLPLLGTSDAIREYEAALRDAAGTTQEVADKQLEAVSEKLGLVTKNLIATKDEILTGFVPAIEEMLDRLIEAAPQIEAFGNELGRILGEQIAAGIREPVTGGASGILDELTRIVRQRVRNLFGAARTSAAQAAGAGPDTGEPAPVLARTAASLAGDGGAAAVVTEFSDEAQKAFDALKAVIAEVENLGRVRATAAGFGLPLVPDDLRGSLTDLAEVRQNIEQVEDALRLVPAAAPEFAQLQAVLGGLNEQAADLERSITAALGDLPSRLAALDDIAPALAPIGQVSTQIDAVAVGLNTVELAAQGAARASEQLTLARLAGDPERVATAEERLSDARDQLRDRTALLVGALDRANVSGERQKQIVEELIGIYAAAGIQIDDVTTSTLSLADAFGVIESTGRGLVSVADSIGAIDDSTRRALTGVLDLVRGLEQIQRAGQLSGLASTLGLFGGIGAGIGGLVGLGSALFGGNDQVAQQEQERQRAIDANTDALERLRASMDGFRLTGDVIESSLGAFRSGRIPTGRRAAPNPEDLFEVYGITPETLRGLEERFGLDLIDDTGVVIAGAVNAFIEALETAQGALTGFGDSLDAVQRERGLRDRILGVDRTPQQEIDALINDLAQVAPDLVQQFLGGIDTSDTDAVRTSLEGLLDAFAVGGDEFAELMGGLTREDFLGWLDSAAGSLEKLDETVDATTNAIRNVPSWFRLQAAVLNAADPDPFDPVVPPAPPPRHPVTPPDQIGGPRPGGPIVEPGVNPGIQLTFNIVQQPGEDGERFARRTAEMVKRQFQRENLARTGNSHGQFTL